MKNQTVVFSAQYSGPLTGPQNSFTDIRVTIKVINLDDFIKATPDSEVWVNGFVDESTFTCTKKYLSDFRIIAIDTRDI